jgi:hypothetical protein
MPSFCTRLVYIFSRKESGFVCRSPVALVVVADIAPGFGTMNNINL